MISFYYFIEISNDIKPTENQIFHDDKNSKQEARKNNGMTRI